MIFMVIKSLEKCQSLEKSLEAAGY